MLVIVLFLGEQIFQVKGKKATEEWTLENGVHYTMLFHSFVFM